MAKALGRRDFVKSSVAATGSVLLVKPETAFGSAANSTLNIALLGCGGRGSGVAADFVNHTNTQITVLGDSFGTQLDAAEKRFNELQAGKGRGKVAKKFKGPDAHLAVAGSDVDIVLIGTPPYYHPEHLKAALDGNKHVYLEKPVATDVKGCMQVAALAAKAEGKVSVDVGFQIRRGSQYAEQTKRLHEGAIGDITCAHGYYFASDLPRRPVEGLSRSAGMLRNWYYYRELAGDIIVEQNIHIIDVFNWIMKAHPLRAMATAGRKVRTDIGNVMDHYVVTYIYPNDVRVSFSSTQFGTQWAGVSWRCFGAKGYSEASYSGSPLIRGAVTWDAVAQVAGEKPPEIDPLGDATPLKAQAFVESIHSGKFHNELKSGSESTLSAILARESAYEGREMTWGELLASNQAYDTEVDLTQV